MVIEKEIDSKLNVSDSSSVPWWVDFSMLLDSLCCIWQANIITLIILDATFALKTQDQRLSKNIQFIIDLFNS